ncbi:MAG: FAD-dependent oxidoreductase [Cyanobacteria bacterium P01_A01_bin.40]
MPSSNRSTINADCIVIGGGITGLITATVLQRQGLKVTVLDKGRGIGGRLATRRIVNEEDTEGVFDYGTQYFSVKQPQFQVWVDEWLEQGVVQEWCQGFGEPDGKPRYCGVNGTRDIAKYLARDLDIHTSTRVVKVSYDAHWRVETAEKHYYQGDMLVMTPPVPQSLNLLDASQIQLPVEIRKSLEQIDYHSCLAVLALLEKPSQIPPPGGVALEHESLVWLGDNHQKGISPRGYAVTIHANPDFSNAHWERDDSEIAEYLFDQASSYLGSTVVDFQVHRWRYSLPQTFYPEPCLKLPQLSLVMAGDAFVAPKIEGAVTSGMAAGEFIVNSQSRVK